MKSMGLALALLILIPAYSPAQSPPTGAEKSRQEAEQKLERFRAPGDAGRNLSEAQRQYDRDAKKLQESLKALDRALGNK